MTMITNLVRPSLAPLFVLAACSVASAAQDSGSPPETQGAPEGSPPRRRPGQPTAGPPSLPQGVTREQMWPAPTAEDWAKPCLVEFQRTWEDAIAVARETGKPLLICVNMDGEIASEHYAGIRYREPEKAKLYDPYVCVIASVYRHAPRDHDDEGRRILCPRFGSVTCGEHIAIEPQLYDQYFDGERVAPRHIGVELVNGEPTKSEMYDVYFAWDTDTVFNSIKDGIANRKDVPQPIVRGDRSLLEKVASRDAKDRTEVEEAYATGDRERKKALLEAALANPESAPIDLLREAIFGFDLELAKLARAALAKVTSPDATGLLVDALKVPMEEPEREALLAALARIGERSPRARTLAVVHRGLGAGSDAIDESSWSKELATKPAPVVVDEAAMLEARIQYQDQVLRSGDAKAKLDLAEAFLRRAVEADFAPADAVTNAAQQEEFARLLYLDAQRSAQDAAKQGEAGWRGDALLALAAYYLDDAKEAAARAEQAVKALPAGAAEWSAMAVLELFAKLRAQQIAEAQQQKRDWPPQWLSDVHAACAVLSRHPLGTDAQSAWHYDVLQWLGAEGRAARVLNEGLGRFPESATLHERMRNRVLEERGHAGLEPAYQALIEARGSSPALEWYAAHASIATAEFERRAGAAEPALAAYDRAIARFEHCAAANPDWRESADAEIAMAHAGRARIAFERGEHERAVAELLAAFERRPDAAATLDGLNVSAVDTAKLLLQRLREQGPKELEQRLDAALKTLDPELLALPAYERDVQNR